MPSLNQNPFTSEVFTHVWLKHFNGGDAGIAFPYFDGLLFVKHRFSNFFFNVGRTHTKGISYRLRNSGEESAPKSVFLIYDVPAYFFRGQKATSHLKCIKTIQYPGYLIELQDYNTLDDYLTTVFNRKSRKKLRSYKRKLEKNNNITYKMYCGNISRHEYNLVFRKFRVLLEKRFEDKREYNNNLDSREWSFYEEVAYPLILQKKASLLVVFDDGEPIGVLLNYMSEETIHAAITVFDIDYSNFNIGTVNIMKLIEWALENGYRVVDFSKGHYDYKTRWGSLKYNFEYHIWYNSKSLYSTGLAVSLKLFFGIKHLLRRLRINELLHKVTFAINKSK